MTAVQFAIPAIRVASFGNVCARELNQNIIPGVDAVRPGVVRLDAVAFCTSLLNRKQQPVVISCSAVVQLRDVAIKDSLCGILQVQCSSRIHIGCTVDGQSSLRAPGIGGRHVWNSRNEYAGIPLVAAPNMERRVAHIVRRHQPVRTELSLDTEIPLLRVGGFGIGEKVFKCTEVDERRIFA